jgi:hypothetical protein
MQKKGICIDLIDGSLGLIVATDREATSAEWSLLDRFRVREKTTSATCLFFALQPGALRYPKFFLILRACARARSNLIRSAR